MRTCSLILYLSKWLCFWGWKQLKSHQTQTLAAVRLVLWSLADARPCCRVISTTERRWYLHLQSLYKVIIHFHFPSFLVQVSNGLLIPPRTRLIIKFYWVLLKFFFVSHNIQYTATYLVLCSYQALTSSKCGSEFSVAWSL